MASRPKIRPVILCGGSGTRLWPLSRPEFPKQFLVLKGETSLLEQTLMRAAAVSAGTAPILIAAARHRRLVVESLRRANVQAELIFEPVARNTAPAVAAAALIAAKCDPDDILVVMPSDHVVEGIDGFVRSVEAAARLACDGWITILGVVPNEPSSALGYIVPGEALGEEGSRVARFVEKPPRETAEQLIGVGALWNAGMVVAKASVVIEALRRHEPTVLSAVAEALAMGVSEHECQPDADAFERAPRISFDHAVLERHPRVAVTPLQASWRDVGTWSEVAALHECDQDGNRLVGDVLAVSASDSFIRASDRRVVALGIENLVVVDAPDGLLIATRTHLPSLGNAVESLPRDMLGLRDRTRAEWGDTQVILQDASSRVSRFAIEAGEATSPDVHGELRGHWIVVSGHGVATIGARTCGVSAGDMVQLPHGEKRWLANTGEDALGVLEVILQLALEDDAELRRAV